MSESLVQAIGKYVYQLSYNDLSKDAIEKAKAIILQNLSNALAAYGKEPAQMTIELIKSEEAVGSRGATIWIDGSRVSILGAAFANTLLCNSRAQCSTHGTSHIGTMVIPVSIACAEQEKKSGKDLISSVIAGYEVTAKLGKEHTVFSTARGFRATSIYGVFGNAVTAGKLLGLNEEHIINALGFAAGFAFGTTESFSAGSMEWNFQNGVAARIGILAALIAKAGAQGAPSALEGKSGFYYAFTGKRENLSKITDHLGDPLEVFNVDFKYYPVCTFNQTPISTALEMVKEFDLIPEKIEHIKVKMNPYEATYPGIDYKGPFSNIGQTLMSTPFCVAASLVNREFKTKTLEQFDSPQINYLVSKTTIEADDSKRPSCAEIIVLYEDGKTFTKDLNITPEHYHFSLEHDKEVVRRLASEIILPEKNFYEMIDLIAHLEQLKNLDHLLEIITL